MPNLAHSKPPAALNGAPGAIIYRGPSMIDGAPIVVVLTGFDGARNAKTGADMLQLYILADTGPAITPAAAARSGADAAACGSCPLRGAFKPAAAGGGVERTTGSRVCYVHLGNGPAIVHRSLHRGVYADMTRAHHNTLATLTVGRGIRLGAYGDAAAVPQNRIRPLARRSAYWTGYTHQPETASWLKAYCMASAHSPAHAAELQAKGWRTFRVALAGAAGVASRAKGEMLCPASKEAGKKLTCQDCRACDGTARGRRSNVMIPAHAGMVAAVRRGIVS